jgi:hypothetical protein
MSIPADPDLRQESVVTIGDRELTVVSQVLLDPEPLIVTRVLAGTAVLKSIHSVLSSAVVADYEARGLSALASSLSLSHLRFVRRLLTTDADSTPSSVPAPAGIVATIVFGPNGEKLRAAGEDNVPAMWLRSAWLLCGMGSAIAKQLGLGELRRAEAAGSQVVARLIRRPTTTIAAFVTGDVRPSAEVVWNHLESLDASEGRAPRTDGGTP